MFGKIGMDNKFPTVIVDADALVAQAHPDDSNHQKALSIALHLKTVNARMVYPATAVCEAVTVLQHKLDSSATAYGSAVIFTDPSLQIVEINQATMSRAINNHFSPSTSKKNTLFDCIVLDAAEQYEADAIFSFDHFYKSKGYKLASELK